MYTINSSARIPVIFLILFICTITEVSSQSNVANKYGLFVVSEIKFLQNQTDADPTKQMMNLRKAIPGIVLDLKYSTVQNFMHQKLYPRLNTTFLRRPAVIALKKVINELHQQNLSVKIFDAYRPYSVTEEMWEVVKDDRYAADPSKGSGHNRGIAVDLTLIDLHTKKEIPMGTGFDNFSDTAHMDFKGLPKKILEHRRCLKTIMEKYGFISLSTEWWHYSLPNTNDFELLDVSFAGLKKLRN